MTSTPDEHDASNTHRRWVGRRWDQLRAFSWAVMLLYVVAISALAVGFVNAWRSKNATTPFVVGGALLIVAAVMSREVDELRAKLGDWELFAKFRQGVAEAVITSASVEEVIGRVAILEQEAGRLTRRPPANAAGDASERLLENFHEIDSSLRPGDARVSHRQGVDKWRSVTVYLGLRYRPATPPKSELLKCFVTDPRGDTSTALSTPQPWFSSDSEVRVHSLKYPGNFSADSRASFGGPKLQAQGTYSWNGERTTGHGEKDSPKVRPRRG